MLHVLIVMVLVILLMSAHLIASPQQHTITLAPHLASSSNSTTSTPWLLDTEATHHITTNLDNLTKHSKCKDPEELLISDGNHMPMLNTGSYFISINNHSFNLDNILHVTSCVVILFWFINLLL